MQIGSGIHTYEWVEGWAKIPDDVHLGYTHAISRDSQGRFYIINMSKHAIALLDHDGNWIGSWGEEFAGGCHAVLIREEEGREVLYITHHWLGLMVKSELDGRELLRIGTPPRPDIYDGEERKFFPGGTAVAPNGDIYISDGYGMPFIHRFDSQGRYLDSFGGPGTEPGQFNELPYGGPHGIQLDTRGPQPRLLICDRGNQRLQYWSLDGEYLSMVSGHFRRPNMTFQWQNEIYIPDLHSRITILDRDDNLIAHLCEWENGWQLPNWPDFPHAMRRQPGKFSSPHGIYVDEEGSMYVVEWIEDGRIAKLKRS